MMARAYIYCLTVLVSVIHLVYTLQYSDLKALNASCGQKDSCMRYNRSRLSVSLNWKDRNCFCDNLCSYYGDCCLDAATYTPAEQQLEKLPQQCVVLRNYGGVYMKRLCPAGGGDPRVEELCAAATPESGAARPDPFIALPVTSLSSKITYANYYCAMCNNDTDTLQSWLPRVECPSLAAADKEVQPFSSSSLLDKLEYHNSSWRFGSVAVDGKVHYHYCTVDPYIPDTVVEDVRLCKETISTCPDDYEGAAKDLCNSYTAVVYDGTDAFRNYHCALCHDNTADDISCYSHQFMRFNFRDEFNTASFSVLFDFTDRNGGNSVGFKCNSSEIWDPFFHKCRRVLCASESALYKNGKCLTPSSESADKSEVEVLVANSNNSEEQRPGDRVVYHVNDAVHTNSTHKSQHIIVFPDETVTHAPAVWINSSTQKASLLNCSRILLPHEEFEQKNDGLIFIPKYQKELNRHQYELYDGGVLVCLFDSTTEKFSSIMGWVSLLGLGISFVCLILHLIAFAFLPELRNLSGKNLASLCIALLLAYSCFILGVFGEEGKLECVVLASLVYYFFLASFCWMNVMAFDVWRTLRLATSELRVSAGEQWKKFFLYCTYAWLTPGLALTVMLTVDTVQPAAISESYLPQIGQRLCWFGQRKALLVFFAAPLAVIMTINIVFFVLAAKMIAASAQSTAKFSSCQSHQSHFKLYMRLALLMGLAWISGIMAGYLQEETLWYVFVILNTFQGAFIFAAFTCKKKTFEAFCCSRALLRRFSRPALSSARRNLESRDSHNSQVSQSSAAHLTPQADTSSTQISL